MRGPFPASPWEPAIKTPRTIYEGKIIRLEIEPVELPDGRRFDLEVVRHPGGAAVVALDERGWVCLLRQYRHAAGGWLWELPAGKLEPGEPPLRTAQRELAEEAGLHGERWQPLGTIASSPGILAETIHLFLAQGLHSGERNMDEHELIEVHWFPFAEALEWARSGVIVDAKTLAGLFRAQPFAEAIS